MHLPSSSIMTTETFILFKTTPVISDDTSMEKASFFSNASSLTIVTFMHCWLPLMLPAGNGEEASTAPKSSFSVQMQTTCEDQLYYISWIVIPRLWIMQVHIVFADLLKVWRVGIDTRVKEKDPHTHISQDFQKERSMPPHYFHFPPSPPPIVFVIPLNPSLPLLD